MFIWKPVIGFIILIVAACTYQPKQIPDDLILATWALNPTTPVLADGIQNADLTLALTDLEHKPLAGETICFAASNPNAVLTLHAGQAPVTKGFNAPCQIAATTDARGQIGLNVTLWALAQSQLHIDLKIDAYRLMDGKQDKFYAPGTITFETPEHASMLDAKFSQTTIEANTATQWVVSLLDSNQAIYPGYRGQIEWVCSQSDKSDKQTYVFDGNDQGTHAFSVTFATSGQQTCQVKDSNQPGWQASDSIEVTQQPHVFAAAFAKNTTVVGESIGLAVTVFDLNQTILSNYQESIVVICNEPNHNTTKTHRFSLSDAGTYTFPLQFFSSGTFFCTVSDTQTDPVTTTASITVTDIVYQLKAEFSAAQAQAGTDTALQIQVFNGNDLYTDYRGTIDIQCTDSNATGNKNHVYTASDNASYTTTLRFFSSGLQSCTVADNQNVPVKTTASIQILPSTVSKLGMAFAGLPLRAGDASNPLSITAQDPWGNTVDGYNTTIYVKTDGNPNTQFALVMANSLVSTSNVVFTSAGTHDVKAFDANQTISGDLSVSVVAGNLTRLVWDLASNANVQTYQTFSTTVRLYDDYNNQVVNYAGDLLWKSTDPQAQFFVSGQTTPLTNNTYTVDSTKDLGQKKFDVELKTLTDNVASQVQNITIQASINPNASVTGALNVFPSSNYYVVAKSIGNSNNYFVAGRSYPVIVSAYSPTGDELGSPMYTANILSSPDAPDANVISTIVDQNSNIFVINDAVTFYTASNRSSLVVQDTNQIHLSGALSLPVRAASMANIVLTGLVSAPSGKAQTARVRAVDAYNNPILNYLGTITFSSDNATASLPASYTFTAQDAGQHDFVSGVTLNGNGVFRVVATDTTNNYVAEQNQLVVRP